MIRLARVWLFQQCHARQYLDAQFAQLDFVLLAKLATFTMRIFHLVLSHLHQYQLVFARLAPSSAQVPVPAAPQIVFFAVPPLSVWNANLNFTSQPQTHALRAHQIVLTVMPLDAISVLQA